MNASAEEHYKCECGWTFPEDLGKYGCADCCGESGPAMLVDGPLPAASDHDEN
jgi:hypothetical protein